MRIPDPMVVLSGNGVGQSEALPLAVVGLLDGPGPQADYPPPAELADFDIAVGRDAVLAVSNFGFALYGKFGKQLDFVTVTDFFRPNLQPKHPDVYANSTLDRLAPGHVGDGEVRSLFDPGSGRFFVVASTTLGDCSADHCLSYFVLGVSKSGSPSTLSPEDWHLYSFGGDVRGGDGYPRMVDFTEITVTDSVVAITCQCVVEDPAVLGGEVPGVQGGLAEILLLPKDQLLRGAALSTWNTLTDIPGQRAGSGFLRQVEPVIPLDDGSRLLFAYRGGNCSIEIVEITDPLGTPRVQAAVARAPGECSSHAESPQGPGAIKINTLADDISARPVLRDDQLWGTETIDNPANADLSAIRWFQIDLSQFPDRATFVQDSLYAFDDLSLFYSALTVDPAGNLMMVFGSSGNTNYPSLQFTGRVADDPAGTLRPSVVLAEGGGSNITRSYGDYFGIALDPGDGSAWAYGQYVLSDCRWASTIAQLRWEEADPEVIEYVDAGLLATDKTACIRP